MAFNTYFHVQGAYADLSLKQIIIETNFQIKYSSLTMNNVILYEVDDENKKHELVTYYSLSLDESKKNIIIQLEDYPKDGIKFYLIVKNLVDRLDRVLYQNYDKYIKFSYEIKTKIKIDTPKNQDVLNNNNVEFNIATSCEDKEIRYRMEISRDVAFFKKDYIILSENKNESYSSDDSQYDIIGSEILSATIKALITFKQDGQYYIRIRAEKKDNIAGDWCDVITFSVTTAKTPLEDESGFLNDFLYSSVLYEEEIEPAKVVSFTKCATTTRQFFIEFDKDLITNKDNELVYKDDLIYIGKAFMTRRDL